MQADCVPGAQLACVELASQIGGAAGVSALFCRGECLSSAGPLPELAASGCPADLLACRSITSLHIQRNISRPTDARQIPYVEEAYQRQSQKTCGRGKTAKGITLYCAQDTVRIKLYCAQYLHCNMRNTYTVLCVMPEKMRQMHDSAP